MNRSFPLFLIAAIVLGHTSRADAELILFNQTYTGAELAALVPGTASYPDTALNTLSGSQLRLQGNQNNSVLYRLPIVAAGILSGQSDFVVTVTIDYAQLTGDNDFGVAISDGSRVLGGMQGDSGNTANWSLDSPDNGTTFGPEDFNPVAPLSYTSTMTYVIEASPLAGASRVTATNSGAQSVTHTGLGSGISYASPIDFVLLANNPTELYGVNSVTILATVAAIPEPSTSLLLVLAGLVAAGRRRRRLLG